MILMLRLHLWWNRHHKLRYHSANLSVCSCSKQFVR